MRPNFQHFLYYRTLHQMVGIYLTCLVRYPVQLSAVTGYTDVSCGFHKPNQAKPGYKFFLL